MASVASAVDRFGALVGVKRAADRSFADGMGLDLPARGVRQARNLGELAGFPLWNRRRGSCAPSLGRGESPELLIRALGGDPITADGARRCAFIG